MFQRRKEVFRLKNSIQLRLYIAIKFIIKLTTYILKHENSHTERCVPQLLQKCTRSKESPTHNPNEISSKSSKLEGDTGNLAFSGFRVLSPSHRR